MFDSLTSTEHLSPDNIVTFDDLETFSILATSDSQYGHYHAHFSVTLDDYPGFAAQTLSLPAEVVPFCAGSLFTEVNPVLFNEAPSGTYQESDIFTSYTHELSTVYSDYCGPTILELNPGVAAIPYLTLEQPGLLKFAPVATDAPGTFTHIIRAKLQNYSSVFVDFPFDVTIINCQVLDFFATKPEPDPPTLRQNLATP